MDGWLPLTIAIFLDPDPDPVVSFAERQRLANLDRSSWADYDAALISPGGVYIREPSRQSRLATKCARGSDCRRASMR